MRINENIKKCFAGVTGLIPCTTSPGPSPTPSGLNCDTWQDAVEIIQFLITYAFVIATVLASISFAYAGWLYLTSNGNSGQIESAHKIFLNVIKGFIFIAVAYLLVKTILVGIAQPGYNLLQ